MIVDHFYWHFDKW